MKLVECACCTARLRTAEPRAAVPVKVKGVKAGLSIESQVPCPAPDPSVKPAPCSVTMVLAMVIALARR